MAKTTKTWKIGEYCVGGIISVEITGKVIKVINKDWDASSGYSKRSSQKNAQVLSTGTIDATQTDARWQLFNYLSDLSTSYYADEIIKWIESKVELKNNW